MVIRNITNNIITCITIIIMVFLSACTKETTQEKSYETYQVNAPSNLIVRSSPSKTGEKISSMPNRTIVNVDRFEDGWAHIVSEDYHGYANGEYLIKLNSEEYVKSPTNQTIKDSRSDNTFRKFGYKNLPYFILGVSLIYVFFIFGRDYERWIDGLGLLALSLCELGYIYCKETYQSNWFLEPSSVGWVMTIIDYGLLIGLTCIQGLSVIQWSTTYASGCFNLIATWVFSLLGGICVFALIIGASGLDEAITLFTIIGGTFVLVAINFAVIYYAIRDWSLAWKTCITNMFFISSYVVTILFFAWPLILALFGILFLKGLGSGQLGLAMNYLSDTNDESPVSNGMTNDDNNFGELLDSEGRRIDVEFTENGDKAVATDWSGRKFRKKISGDFEEYV